jgi:hypothetical protein
MEEEENVVPSAIRPHYYRVGTPYELNKVLIEYGFDKDLFLGQAICYMFRAGKKDEQNEIEDLEKAEYYLSLKIKQLKAAVKP